MSGILIASTVAGPTLPTSNLSATDSVSSPGSATATINFLNDGNVVDQDVSNVGDWILPNDFAPGDYEIRANSSSPDTPESGTMDTWLALTSQRAWSVSQSGAGTDARTFTVDFRRSGGPVLATRNCTITAEVNV